MSAAGLRPRVGILALQGDVREHARVLEGLGAEVVLVRRPAELQQVDGLLLPGGESSTIDKLVRAFGLRDPLREAIAAGLPVYGTCAGMILLADRILGAIDGQQTLGGLDITVRRNAFGGQVESFETGLDVPSMDPPVVRAAFIRAPVVEQIGPAVDRVATLPDGRVVAVAQGNLLATSFHPEVTGELRFHQRFLEWVRREATAEMSAGAGSLLLSP